jgi:subtilisin family serine protease
MLATRTLPGIQPLSVESVVRVLSESPDIHVVKRISPPRLFNLESVGESPATVVVADIEPARAKALSASGQGSVVVERDELLSMAIPSPSMSTVSKLPNPGVFFPSSTGFSATFEVTGPDGPVADANVQLFGKLFPAQGRTDAQGRVTLEIAGEDPESIQAIYVKPKADHWDFWHRDPELSTTEVNPIRLKSITPLPGSNGQNTPWIGWGQRAMGLDHLPPNFDGRGVKVAVIDSGAAQATHRNLHNLGPGLSVIGDDPKAWGDDQIGHGSHCAAIIGGTFRPGTGGLRGFAPGAEIHVCRVFPGGRFHDLIAALDYCMENGIDIASMSLGSDGGSQILANRIDHARTLGIACIVAAGNSSGAVNFPAMLPSTLAVSAIGKFGEFPPDSFHGQQVLDGFEGRQGFFPAGFSCFGPEVDVCGPGVAIISAVPPDDFAAWDGTSMATPHVAGLAALVLAHHPDFRGRFSARNSDRVDRLFDIIRASCQPLPFGPERIGRGLPWAPRALGLEETQRLTPGEVPPESFEALRRLLQLIK